MKATNIKEIFLGNYKINFHRVKKDYLVYLQGKSICKRSSFTKMPKNRYYFSRFRR